MHTKITGTIITTSSDVLTRTNFQALLVKLFQTTVNEEKELAAANVKEDGSFEASIEVPESTMLTARLYLKADGKRIKQVAETGPHCPKENLALLFEYDSLKHGQPLFTALKERITPQLGKLKLKDTDKEQQRKLECIAGVGSLALARLMNTERLADELKKLVQKKSAGKTGSAKRTYATQADDTQLSAAAEAALFALLKNDYQAGLSKILAISPKQLEAKLQPAVKANEIAPLPNQSAVTEMLMGVRDTLLFNSNDDENAYDAKLIHISSAGSAAKTDLLNKSIDEGSLKNLLAASAPAKEPAKKQTAAAAKKVKAGVPASSVKPAVSPALAKELQAIVELDEQLKKFPPLLEVTVNAIRTKAGEIDLQKLAGKTESDWLVLIKKIPGTKQFPKTYPDNKESAKLYAREIAAGFTKKFPALTVISNLGNSKIAGKSSFISILTKNPGFDITKQSVNTWFKVTEKPGAANEISAKNLQYLQKLQRCIKLTDGLHNMKHTEALLQGGMESSHHITRMGKYEFTQAMKKQKLTEAESTVIYNRAKHINNTVKMLAVNYLRYENKESLMPHYLNFGRLAADDAIGLPDMESIFGSLNSCSCSECQSVYSAAAYLTDLLHWLKSDIVCQSSGVNGLTALSGTLADPRRKDISYILLNCKNTNELLPYIDLVNEILSINLFKSPDYSILQTTKSSKELIAEPEHRFESEWELTRAFFPFTLPYDAGWDASATYLKELGIQHHELINGFAKVADKYNSAAWAKACLGFNDAEFDLVKQSHPANGEVGFWQKYWGISTAPNNVGTILKSTGFSLAELKEYLGSFYINRADTPIEIVPPEEDDCNIDLYELSKSFTIAIADRFMRFMRIRRKTNISVWELDIAISNFGKKIDENFLVKLASVMAFCKEHHISFTEAMVLLSEKAYQDVFNSSKTSEYYENTFRNKSFHNDTRKFFDTTLTSGNSINTSIGQMTDENKVHACRVLNITDVEFTYLTDFIGYDIGDYLTLTNLAAYHRYVIFCKIFNIEIVELGNLFGSTPLILNPFTGAGSSIQKIWEFKYKWNELKLLNVNPQELRSIVSGEGRYKLNSSGLAINLGFANEAKDLWLKIQESLTNTRNANPQVYIDTATGNVSNFPVKSDDIDLFKDIIVTQISNELGLGKTIVNDLINHYSSVWLYANTYYNILTPLAWTPAIAGNFTKTYRFLLRVSVLAKICGVSNEGLTEAVSQVYSGSSPLLKSSFYWLKNNFTVIDFLPRLSLIKKATGQAAVMNITQEEYLKQIFHINTYSPDALINPPAIIAATLYYAMGQNSLFSKISVYQFSEMYFKAQTLTVTPKNMVTVLEASITMFQTCTSAKISFDDAWNWVYKQTGSPGVFQPVSIATFYNDIKRIFRSRYASDDAWYKFITPIHNGLRMRLRDALVAYYIGQKGFENSNAIYAHFLLDSEMEPCMKTSRIVQAISSVQLLIHRGLMGLEQQMCMDEDDKKEWEWRKNYRVWEANRKVFIYPENWIEPSLRLDKTPFFKEVEDILAQDEINTANAEKAFATYLCNLNNIARLDIRGTYAEELEGSIEYPFLEAELIPDTNIVTTGKEPKTILHVIGRTWNPPYVYFHRKREKNIWTAWEKIELDIEGDHLMPTMFNRRLYLFWPLFIEKEHRTIKIDDQNAPYYEIKMCYSKLEFGKWSSKKILDGSIYAGQYSGPGVYNNLERKLGQYINQSTVTSRGNLVLDNNLFQDYCQVSMEKNDFYFWAERQDNGNLIIHSRRRVNKLWERYYIGYSEFSYEDSFLINNCNDKVEIISPQVREPLPNEKRYLSRPWLTIPYAQQMKKGLDAYDTMNDRGENGLYLKGAKSVGGDRSNGEQFLKATHSEYILTYPHQYPHNLWNQPFFYSDKQNSFFVHLYGLEISWVQNITKWLGTFQDFQHPYACMMTAELNKFGLDGLLNAKDNELERQQASNAVPYFPTYYQSDYTFNAVPVKEFDFAVKGSYSIYNWEIFFHTVSLIARQLRQNNKFAEAIRWLQFVFDPTNRDTQYGNLRYWKIKPFMKDVTEGSMQKLMQMLSGTNQDPVEVQKREELAIQIAEWRDNPFDPHKIASMRNRAYMLWTVMEYIETLTDWADSLFRQFTMESVNEAINLYVLASEILGKRPQKIEKAKSTDISFNEIENNLDAFSNTAVAIETIMGHDGHMPLNGPAYNLPELVFCIPENPKLKELWDRVEDRLFKIRHCMNIDGKKVELALFQPPIDPALLVRAGAMGMDLADVLSDLAAPPPHYRFSFLLQKATDFCNEVKSLGGQLLSALEKKDSEELAQIRQVHEQNILKAARNIKKIQIDDAKNSYASLQHSKKLIEIRLNDYSSREFISSKEEKTISLTKKAEGFMYAEQGANLVAGLTVFIPDLYASVPPKAKVAGGDKIAAAARAVGSAFGVVSSVFRNMASLSSTYAGYDRRQEEWNLQIKTATEELNQMEKQLLGAEIRIAITEKELDNHDLQVEQSKEMYDHLKSKFSNLQLYTWMSGELMKLYRQSYELAYDMAKKAQQAYYKELGVTGDSVVNFGHWDSSRKGLLAGERLSLQLKQLDAAYIKNNIREYEITKHVSLSLLDPLALVSLRNTGKCEIEIPEVLYDLDYPGHYFRRIKSVSISMPCIAGPYTSVNAKLSLDKHSLKRSANDTILETVLGHSESIVTSGAQNDSGVFELNFRDERYVPFEGAGAVSSWNLELTNAIDQFDLSTIADVVLHIKYTARDGGNDVRNTVSDGVKAKLNSIKQELEQTGLHIAINMKHDMPNEWHLLKQSGSVDVIIDKSRLPYLAQALSPTIESIMFIADGITAILTPDEVEITSPVSSNLKYGTKTVPDTIQDLPFSLQISLSSPAEKGNLKELILVTKYKVSE